MTIGYHSSDVAVKTTPKAEIIVFNLNHHLLLMKGPRPGVEMCGISAVPDNFVILGKLLTSLGSGLLLD